MQLAIAADLLTRQPPAHAWRDDWQEVLGLPEGAELDRFEGLSENEETRIAAASCEWIHARLAPYADTVELNRAFIDALWSRAGHDTDVDPERRSNAGIGAVDGVLRLMRELGRTAGDLAHATPGLVRLALLVTSDAHATVLHQWLEHLIATPPDPPAQAIGDANPFLSIHALSVNAEAFDTAEYDAFHTGGRWPRSDRKSS